MNDTLVSDVDISFQSGTYIVNAISNLFNNRKIMPKYFSLSYKIFLLLIQNVSYYVLGHVKSWHSLRTYSRTCMYIRQKRGFKQLWCSVDLIINFRFMMSYKSTKICIKTIQIKLLSYIYTWPSINKSGQNSTNRLLFTFPMLHFISWNASAPILYIVETQNVTNGKW